MAGRKNIEEFYRKLKVGTKLKYAFTTVIVTLAIAVVVSLVSIVKMNVDTYKFYKEAYANSTLQMEIRKDIQLVGKYILWSMTTDDASSTQSYSNLAQKYADQVGKNVTALEKSYNDKKKVAELKDAIEELKKQRAAVVELAKRNKNDEALALFNSDYNDATEKIQDILVDIRKSGIRRGKESVYICQGNGTCEHYSDDSHRSRNSGFLHCHPDHHYRNYAKANSGTGKCS